MAPSRRALAGLAGAGVAAGAVVLAVAVDLPDVSEAIEEAPERLGRWSYVFGAAMGFMEMGSLLGVAFLFEVGVVLAGALAGEGEIAIVPLVLFTWVASTLGESLNFWTGRRFGRPFLERHGPRFKVTPELQARVEAHFERRGPATIFVSRFIPLVRSTAPFVAGSTLIAYRRFLPWSIAGNLAWAAAFCGLGYAFYRSADQVADAVGTAGGVVALLIVVAVVALVVRGRRRRRATAPTSAS